MTDIDVSALTEALASLSVMTENAASMAKIARDVRAERDALIEGRDMMGRLWEKEKAEAAKLRLEVQHALDTADAAIAGQKAAEAERDAALAEVARLRDALREIKQKALPIYGDDELDAKTIRAVWGVARAALAKWETANE